jgi:PPIC-type PPIASE domain
MTRFKGRCLFVGLLLLMAIPQRKSMAQTFNRSESGAHNCNRESSGIALDSAVITIEGLCDLSTKETGAANCRMVITRAQFEKVIDAIQPGMPARARREFALDYVDFLRMARKAEEMGLDKGPEFDEQMKLARVQVLARDLKRAIQQKASQISDKDVENYYLSNTAKFQRAEVERIYIPKTQQPSPGLERIGTDSDRRKRNEQSEQTMKDEAEFLHARAIAGEDFGNLQLNAYEVAGIKSTPPSTNMVIRRSSLPPNQISVMDLKIGEVSSVFADPNGYFVYKIKTKDLVPLAQVHDEIVATLRAQNMQNEMRDIRGSANPVLEESYFVHQKE